MRSGMLTILIVAAPLAAHAEPLLLPSGTAQGEVSFELTSVSENGISASGESVVVGMDYGASDRLQLGLSASAAINPGAFGSVDATGELALGPFAAVRLDAAITRETLTFLDQRGSLNMYDVALSLPSRIRLADGIALTTGRTGAAGFGRPMTYSVGNGSVALGSTPFFGGDSIVAISVNDDGSVAASVQAPVGLLITPVRNVSIALRSGFRHVAPIGGGSWNAIPAGVDLVVRAGALDVGATFEVAGQIDTSAGYFDLRQAAIWAQARI